MVEPIDLFSCNASSAFAKHPSSRFSPAMAGHGQEQTENDDGDDDGSQWLYSMQVAQALPSVNLGATPISKLLSPVHHDKFMGVMRRRYEQFSLMFRVSGVLVLSVLFVPQEIGSALSVPTFLMALPALSCSILMHSSDLMRILVRQFEFWFFTVMNAINWGCLASFYSDWRMLSLLGCAIGTQLVVTLDANFRTVSSGIRSTVVAAPLLLVLSVATFFRVIDTNGSNYRVIPVAKVKVSLVDIFANTAVTLAVFIARKGYSKRKVLITRTDAKQTIRCVVFRSKLQFHPLPKPVRSLADSGLTHVDSALPPSGLPLLRSLRDVTATESRTATNFFASPQLNDLHPPSPSPTAHPDASRRSPCSTQQLELVTMAFSVVDVRHTLLPRLTPLDKPLSLWQAIVLYTNAVVGFSATVYTLTRPSAPHTNTMNHEKVVACLSLLCTTLFIFSMATSFHRVVVKSLVQNFDFLFSSVQFTLAMALICDMLQYDFRMCGAIAWFLWFHFVLLVDALTPHVKKHLWFRKCWTLPVILISLLQIGLLIYAFFFADASVFFIDRTIWETTFQGHHVGLRTKSLLLNRLFTIILWSCRLVFEVAWCPENELIFIRVGLDYYTHLEMFPPIKPVSLESKTRRSSRRRSSAGVVGWLTKTTSVHPLDAPLAEPSQE